MFTVLYIAFALLSPSVLPEAIYSLHVNIILGVLTLLAILPSLSDAKLGSIPEPRLVLGLIVGVGMSIAATGWISQSFVIVDDYLPIFLVFYFVVISCRSLPQLKILSFTLLGVALFIFLQGALADRAGDVTSPYLLEEATNGSSILRYRGLGVISDPNDLAQFFIMVIPLLWLRWKKGSFLTNFLFTLLPAAVLAGGVYFTHSRGGAIALVAVVLFALKDKLGVVKSSILAAALFAAMVALNVSGGRGMNEDDGGRVAAWILGLELFKHHPVFGIGVGNFGDYNDTGSTAHNSFVLVLAESGLFGYFFWMGTIVAAWSGLSQIARRAIQIAPSGETARAAKIPPRFAFRPAVQEPLVLAAAGGPPIEASSSITRMAKVAIVHRPGEGNTVGFHRLAGSGARNGHPDGESLAYPAKVLQVSMVGLLASSYFLSRSFSMVFYILLGMAAAMKLTYDRANPETPVNDPILYKRIWIVIFISIILLYVFVRVRGIH